MVQLVLTGVIVANALDRKFNSDKYTEENKREKERRSRMTREERRTEDLGKLYRRMR